MPVAALQFKKFEKGALCGFLAIRYHGLTIRDCRLMENKGGGFWVALPQKEVTIDGERKWVDLLQLGRDEQDFLNRQVVGQLRQRGDLPGGRQQGPRATAAVIGTGSRTGPRGLFPTGPGRRCRFLTALPWRYPIPSGNGVHRLAPVGGLHLFINGAGAWW